MHRTRTLLPEFLALGFLLLYLAWGLIQLRALHFNTWDYGIFQQAMYEISSGASLNPWLTVRGIYIFNEHLHPILIPLSYLTRLMGYSVASPFVIEWLAIAVALIFTCWMTMGRPVAERALCVGSLIFCRSILTAILFPVHTDTWALLPQMLIVYGLFHKRFPLVFFSSLLLITFKETYCFGIVGLSGFYLLKKDFKRFIPLFLLGAFFVILELGPRKALIGDGHYYAQSYAQLILQDPLGVLVIMLKTMASESFIKVFTPYLLPVGWIVLKGSEKQKNLLLGGLCYLAPLILIHLIIERFHFHHASIHGIILSSVLIFSGFFGDISKYHRRFTVLASLIFILIGMGSYTRMIKVVSASIAQKPPYQKEARESFAQARTIINERASSESKIYATGGMIVHLLAPQRNLYHQAGSKPQESYDFLAFQRAPYGDLWPISGEDVERLIDSCRIYADTIHIDNEFTFIAEGNFPKTCISSQIR